MSAKDEPKAADDAAKAKVQGGPVAPKSREVADRDLDKIAGGVVGPCNMPDRRRTS
jgi:hypothetical protein